MAEQQQKNPPISNKSIQISISETQWNHVGDLSLHQDPNDPVLMSLESLMAAGIGSSSQWIDGGIKSLFFTVKSTTSVMP